MAFEIKRNDRRPRYRVQLTVDENPADITGAAAVRFTMKTGATTKVNKGTMTIIDAVSGIVEYAWGALDTDTSGDYNVEVEVDWGGGETQSFPSTGYFTAKINDDLA